MAVRLTLFSSPQAEFIKPVSNICFDLLRFVLETYKWAYLSQPTAKLLRRELEDGYHANFLYKNMNAEMFQTFFI